MIERRPSPQPSALPRPLCPVCGSTTIRITTSVLVEYDLIYDGHSRDFAVIDELIGDAMWDEASAVHCPVCAWHGTIAELRRNEPHKG